LDQIHRVLALEVVSFSDHDAFYNNIDFKRRWLGVFLKTCHEPPNPVFAALPP
jgi:hypothetical protein